MPFSHHILLLGATGPTGREIALQALAQGHSVTALARRPDRLKLQHPRLRSVAADLTAGPDPLAQVLPGHDVVVSALGRGKALRSHGLMARVTPVLLSAMERQSVTRLVFLSAYGVGGTAPQAPLIFRFMFRVMLADIYADKALAESLVRASALEWTILAPVVLSDGSASGKYRMGEHVAVHGFARIPRVDVAAAVLSCLDDTTSLHKRYIVAP